MFRNDVTFKAKSAKNVCHFFKRVQILYQNNNKLSPLTQEYWNFATTSRSWENIICCTFFPYWLNTEICHDIVLYLIISHVAFRDYRVHIFYDNHSRNSCILKQWHNWAQKWWFLTHLLWPMITILARDDRTAVVVAFSWRQIKLLKEFV